MGRFDDAVFEAMDKDYQRTVALARTLNKPIIDDIEHLLTHATQACCAGYTDDFGDAIGVAESVRQWLHRSNEEVPQ